jgi:hypothetical protein
MKPAPTLAAAAALAFAIGQPLLAPTVARAQGRPITSSMDLPDSPQAPLAPTVHQLALAATPAPPVELWRGAALGMTLDQVQALFPLGHAPAGVGKPPALPAQDDGTLALWQMDDQVYGRSGVAPF